MQNLGSAQRPNQIVRRKYATVGLLTIVKKTSFEFVSDSDPGICNLRATIQERSAQVAEMAGKLNSTRSSDPRVSPFVCWRISGLIMAGTYPLSQAECVYKRTSRKIFSVAVSSRSAAHFCLNGSGAHAHAGKAAVNSEWLPRLNAGKAALARGRAAGQIDLVLRQPGRSGGNPPDMSVFRPCDRLQRPATVAERGPPVINE